MIFTGPFIDFFLQYLITRFLRGVRQEVSNFDSSVVVHELELAINCVLYGCCAVKVTNSCFCIVVLRPR